MIKYKFIYEYILKNILLKVIFVKILFKNDF